MSERCDERTPKTRRGESLTGGPSSLVVLLAVTFLAFVNYAALLPVVPSWASTGGAGSMAVGGTTGVMMAATVATQLAMPWWFRRISLRGMIILGAVLLGAPTPFYALSAEITPIMLITVIRGIGFAFVVTAGATLAADVASTGGLSRSASYYGTAAALPNVGALGGGIWIAANWGYPTVFVSAGVASLAGALVACGLPRRSHGTFRLGSLRDVRPIVLPIILFVLTAAAFGAATAFLPLSGPSPGTATMALLAASVALVLARLAAGVIGDRYGAGRLLTGSVLTSVIGCFLIAPSLHGPAWVLILGASLVGAGFGACQNDSFVFTVQQLGHSRSATASTVWNIAYDGGLGLGALGLGWAIGTLGHAGAFITLAISSVSALLVCLLMTNRHRLEGNHHEPLDHPV